MANFLVGIFSFSVKFISLVLLQFAATDVKPNESSKLMLGHVRGGAHTGAKPNNMCTGFFQSNQSSSWNGLFYNNWRIWTKHEKIFTLYTCNGTEVDRTSSVPKSVLRLCVDKGQHLQSGILFFTSLVLLQN